MQAKVGILISELVLRLQNSTTRLLVGTSSSTLVCLEITMFGQHRHSRFYTVLCSGWPIHPCEKMHFHKEFPDCKTIAELLVRLKGELVTLRLWAEYTTELSSSPSRIEILADYEDSVFNFLYPYDTLNPSYDVIARNVRLHSAKAPRGDFVARLKLSVNISGLIDKPLIPRRQFQPTVTQQSPRYNRFPSPVVTPSYMRPTYSSLMAAYVTSRCAGGSANV